MTSPNSKHNNAITQFLNEALRELNKGTSFSRHLDELLTDIPPSSAEQVNLALELYDILTDQYKSHSDSFMALLVLAIEDNETISQDYKLHDLLSGQLKLSAPPELYLTKRGDNRSPYVVEEYKLPIQQNAIRSTTDCIYAYFRAHRNEPEDTYGQGFYFEHYPEGDTDHSWK